MTLFPLVSSLALFSASYLFVQPSEMSSIFFNRQAGHCPASAFVKQKNTRVSGSDDVRSEGELNFTHVLYPGTLRVVYRDGFADGELEFEGRLLDNYKDCVATGTFRTSTIEGRVQFAVGYVKIVLKSRSLPIGGDHYFTDARARISTALWSARIDAP